MKSSALPVLLLALGACSDLPTPTIRQSPIVGGTMDRADPAVGAVLIEDSQGFIRGICTGTLISKRVVMTAAHCVDIDDPEIPDASPKQVYFGTQLKEASGGIGTFNVVRTTFHSTYNSKRIESGGDIALLLLDRAPPVTPVPIYRTKLEGKQGTRVRIVGFGITAGGGRDEGTKRETMTTLDQVDSKLIWFFSTGNNTCNGDSGGPTFITDGSGHEAVAGVTSFGDEDCVREGANSRVDIYAASFIDPWIAANDPGTTTPPVTDPPVTTCTGAACPGTDPGGAVGDDTDDTLAPEGVQGGCSVAHGARPDASWLLLGLALVLKRRKDSVKK